MQGIMATAANKTCKKMCLISYLLILVQFLFKINLVLTHTSFKSSVASHCLKEKLLAWTTRLFKNLANPTLPTSCSAILSQALQTQDTSSYFPVTETACFYRLCFSKCYFLWLNTLSSSPLWEFLPQRYQVSMPKHGTHHMVYKSCLKVCFFHLAVSSLQDRSCITHESIFIVNIQWSLVAWKSKGEV